MDFLEYYKDKKVGVYDAKTNRWHAVSRMTIANGCFQDVVFNEDTHSQVFDLYVLPGFIDAHCHILENPICPDICRIANDESNISNLLKVASQNILTAMEAGITSIKDLGGRNFLSVDIAKRLNESLGTTRVYTSGCYFTSRGGHCSDRGGVVVDCLEEFVRGINYLRAHDIIYCKIIHGDEGFESQMLLNMVQIAHQNGMIVSCHSYTEKAAFEAVNAGVDILEHAGDYSEGLLDTIKVKNIIIVPTFVSAYDGLNSSSVLTDVDYSVLQTWYDGEKKVIPKLFKKNIKVALGTDGGFDGTLFNSLIREIRLIRQVFPFISIEQLLYSAFVVTPQTIGMQCKLGKICKDYLADFQVYDKDPITDIDNVLGNPFSVWVNGEEIYRNIDIKDVVIRNLSKNDVNNIMKSINHPFFDCTFNGDFWSPNEIESWISSTRDCCIGAFLGNKLIGYCLTHCHEEVHKVHLENIFVEKPYRNHGIGRRLIDEIVRHYQGEASLLRFVGLIDNNNVAAFLLLNKSDFIKGSTYFWMQKNV